MITSRILLPKTILKDYIDCFRISHYEGHEEFALRICPNATPGLVFQCSPQGESIMMVGTATHAMHHMPTLFIHGLITELSTMHFSAGPYLTMQVLLRPHTLRAVFGRDASTLTDGHMAPADFGGQTLNTQLMAAPTDSDRIKLLEDFFTDKVQKSRVHDELIEQSLQLVHQHINTVTVGFLLNNLHLSERQFQRRFLQTVGVTPQLYIRIKRFNEAMRLVDEGAYERLSDVAAALNFHDQSHFIRDVKLFSGVTPKSISQKVSDFARDRVVSAYYL